MGRFRLRAAAIALSAAAVAGCTTYDDYGYGGVSVGYGRGGYYDPYYDDYWGYYASSPYWGWYGDYYYPGTGIYVYDRYRRPYRWNDDIRIYWTQRRDYWDGRDRRGDYRENWRDFDDGDIRHYRRERRRYRRY
jgi:hypothetical protein